MLELLNFGASVGAGSMLTMGGKIVNGFMDVITNLSMIGMQNKQQEHDHKIEKFGMLDASKKSAREYKGSKDFHKTRQWIAKLIIFCYFVVPMILPSVMASIGIEMTLSIGYYDIFQKWPWSDSVEVVKWITIGSGGGVPLVITPVMNNTVISIIGMFFGNQMVK